MPTRWRRTLGVLSLSMLLVVSVPGLAAFWDDVDPFVRAAAALVTAGWSELIVQLMNQVRGAKETIEKQLDDAAKQALAEVLQAIQAQGQVVTSAETRVNAAVARGQQAVHTFAAHYMDAKRMQTGVVGSVKGPSSQVSKASAGGGFGTKAPPTATPTPTVVGDLDVVQKGQAWLEARGKEFPGLASEIRKGLDLGSVTAEAHVKAIRTDALNNVLLPLDTMLEELWAGVTYPPLAVPTLAIHLSWIQTKWADTLAGINTSVTGAADEKIRAANPARATAAADWTDRFANVIEAATGKQNASGLTAPQALEQLRRDLGLPRTSIFVLVGESKTTALIRASGGISKVQAQAIASTTFGGARNAAQRLDERRQSLARSVDSYLESQFRGKSPSQIDVTRQDLLRQARQRYAGDARALAAAEKIINLRAAGQPIGDNTLAAIARAAR